MVEKQYQWISGATLEEHSKRKHKILREYFARYLAVRCQLLQQERFRLAIVEGFAGGGRYGCGTAGSPVIFIEELRAATDAFNLKRFSQGMAPLAIECLLILNDTSPDAIEVLKANTQPLVAEAKESAVLIGNSIRLAAEAESVDASCHEGPMSPDLACDCRLISVARRAAGRNPGPSSSA